MLWALRSNLFVSSCFPSAGEQSWRLFLQPNVSWSPGTIFYGSHAVCAATLAMKVAELNPGQDVELKVKLKVKLKVTLRNPKLKGWKKKQERNTGF